MIMMFFIEISFRKIEEEVMELDGYGSLYY